MSRTLEELILAAFNEDKVFDDITSDSCLSSNPSLQFSISSRAKSVFCGQEIISETFKKANQLPKFLDQAFEISFIKPDGSIIDANEPIAKGIASAKLLFACERIILNFIQHLSGIATLTHQFVEALSNPKIKILDTRKNLPNFRALQKYAVLCGGGANHRFDLSEMILIKDNHIAAVGSISKCLAQIQSYYKANPSLAHKKIEIECENLEQVIESLSFKPDFIMLDNMRPETISKACEIIRAKSPQTKIEASGGINLESIATYRDLDLDFISVGSLTHSAKACDIGLDII